MSRAFCLAMNPLGSSRTSRDVIQLFGELNERDATIILVTHDLEVAKAAKRQVVLKDGLIVCDTTDFAEAFEALQNSASAQGEDDSETV